MLSNLSNWISNLFTQQNQVENEEKNQKIVLNSGLKKTNIQQNSIILDSSSFELHEIYKSIDQQHQSVKNLNQQNIMRTLFLKFAEYCYSNKISKDVDYDKYKIDEIIVHYLSPIYDVRLRESAMIL